MGNRMTKCTKTTSSSSSTSMWVDLLEPVTELILERLPLRDYIRFGAVCRKWRSIQRAHRLRHAPGPPPMAHPLPWFIPCNLDNEHLDCYSPLERTSRRLPLPARAQFSCCLSSRRGWLLFHPVPAREQITCCLASCRGWLLLLLVLQKGSLARPVHAHPLLINPVSGAQILLPPLPHDGHCKGAMSAPPTDPNCTILLIVQCRIRQRIRQRILLYRLNDGHANWTGIGTVEKWISFSVFRDGKFYCGTSSLGLYVVDPLAPVPTLQFFEMDRSTVPTMLDLQQYFIYVEFDGKVLMVEVIHDCCSYDVLEFNVFMAVLSEKKWVRLETLGDYVLFLDGGCSLSLLADDVGCKKNCIYQARLFEDGLIAWWVFDLDTREWIDWIPAPFGDNSDDDDECHCAGSDFGHWFLPTLDSVYLAKADCI